MRPRLSTRCPRTRELANLAAVPARFAVLPALLAVGCLFDLPPAVVVDGGMDSGSGGSNMGCENWSPRSDVLRDPPFTPLTKINLCAKATPGPAWIVGGTGVTTYNTMDDTLNGASGPWIFTLEHNSNYKLRVIFVQRLEVQAGAKLRLIGDHPLVVVSWSDIAIAGEVNASSARVGGVATPGAGSPRRSGCSRATAGMGSGGSLNRDGGGGGGGGLGTGGGQGGNGQGGNAGGAGGVSLSAASDFAAGCDGAPSPNLDGSAQAGRGGGAVHVIAKGTITVAASARIHAGGSGGDGLTGTQSEGGGGGGGSGGSIGFDAPTLTIETGAVIAANGGGGGAGCEARLTTGTDTHGKDGDTEGMAAAGGQINECTDGGARGGVGSVGGGSGGMGVTTNSGGGGGGGGGAGFVLAWTSSAPVVPAGSTVTPPFTLRP
jgi:hypothetical protein